MFANNTEIKVALSVINSGLICHKVRSWAADYIIGVDNGIFVEGKKGEYTNEIHKVF